MGNVFIIFAKMLLFFTSKIRKTVVLKNISEEKKLTVIKVKIMTLKKQ